MQHVWAVVLGLVQGLAEFLPISSSAHLTLIPWAFGIDKTYPVFATLQFDVALHAGSALAILLALWSDWVSLAKGVWAREVSDLRFAGFLLVTSIPGAIFGVLLEDKAATVFRSPLLVACSLIAFGLILWAADRYVTRQDELHRMTWGKSAWIGVAQAAAIVPGVSRSGATLTAGRLLGLSREAIAKYSFMAALPIVAGAAVFALRDVPLSKMLSLDWLLGFAAAAVASLIFMRWMLAYVRTHSLAVFMYYRVVIGVIVIVLFLVRG